MAHTPAATTARRPPAVLTLCAPLVPVALARALLAEELADEWAAEADEAAALVAEAATELARDVTDVEAVAAESEL